LHLYSLIQITEINIFSLPKNP